MTVKIKRWCLAVILLTAVSAFSWVPTFGSGDTLKLKSGKIIGMNDTLMFGSPEFADWDSDGVTDMLLGYWGMWPVGSNGGGYGGRIRFFKNRGTALDPDVEDMGDLYSATGVIDLEAA